MGQKIALLIGVSEYGEGLPSLQCPENGVEEMRALLSNPDIGEFNQVVPLVNPNVGEMRSRIEETLIGLSKEDLVLLYFSGHGVKDMYGKFYLTTKDSYKFESGEINQGTAIEAEFVKGALNRCWAERKVVILDCCFSAAFAEGFIGMDDGSIDIKAQLGTKELGEKGCCVLTASTSTQYALEQVDEPLSVYTRYLAEGLRTGGAALEGQTLISARHLHDYVRSQIKIAAPMMEPAIFNALAGDEIVIAKAYVDSEQLYRKQVQKKIERAKGQLGPTAVRNLKRSQNRLGLSSEQAEAILAAVLKPYEEKAKHVNLYAQCLADEKEAEYPLNSAAIQELIEMKQELGLRDEDIADAENGLLGSSLTIYTQQQQRQFVMSEASVKTLTDTVVTTTEQSQSDTSQYDSFTFSSVRVDKQGKEIERILNEAEYFTEELGNGVTLEMVRIPAGEFLMGAGEGEEGARESEYPQHLVKVPEFWIGKYAVTQAQWRAVAAMPKVERDVASDPAHFRGDNHPVEQISWEDAIEFCRRLSQHAKKTTKRAYTLPNEAQWEYACRARTTTPFHFGPTITTDLVCHRNDGTKPVGEFPPNGFGLHDMHGNVWEWCIDGWHENYKDAPTDGSVWESSDKKKVLRGGSWNLDPAVCRAAGRGRVEADDRFVNFGFRVCSFP